MLTFLGESLFIPWTSWGKKLHDHFFYILSWERKWPPSEVQDTGWCGGTWGNMSSVLPPHELKWTDLKVAFFGMEDFRVVSSHHTLHHSNAQGFTKSLNLEFLLQISWVYCDYKSTCNHTLNTYSTVSCAFWVDTLFQWNTQYKNKVLIKHVYSHCFAVLQPHKITLPHNCCILVLVCTKFVYIAMHTK